MPEINDQYYIHQVLDGNSSAYSILVDRHKVSIYHIALKILEHKEEAEEAAQDTFIKAYEKLSTFKEDAKFSTWLYRIAYNTSISRYRKKRPQAITIDETFMRDMNEEALIESIYTEDNNDRIVMLQAALQQLDGKEQLLLELYYDNDLSTAEIATIMQLSQSNVKVKLHRTRQKLFQTLQLLAGKKIKLA